MMPPQNKCCYRRRDKHNWFARSATKRIEKIAATVSFPILTRRHAEPGIYAPAFIDRSFLHHPTRDAINAEGLSAAASSPIFRFQRNWQKTGFKEISTNGYGFRTGFEVSKLLWNPDLTARGISNQDMLK
jgi:hypothetical protein